MVQIGSIMRTTIQISHHVAEYQMGNLIMIRDTDWIDRDCEYGIDHDQFNLSLMIDSICTLAIVIDTHLCWIYSRWYHDRPNIHDPG